MSVGNYRIVLVQTSEGISCGCRAVSPCLDAIGRRNSNTFDAGGSSQNQGGESLELHFDGYGSGEVGGLSLRCRSLELKKNVRKKVTSLTLYASQKWMI